MTDAPPYATAYPKSWWENPALLTAVVLAMAVPLLWPQVPPLTDLPGHMGRYRVQLDAGRTPALAEAFQFRWALIGNLGVDLLVQALAPLVGLERAVKLIVLTIPPLTAAGMLFVAREVHGRIPPTAFFALPLAYGFPFQFGFVNFALSMALALLGFGLWLRLGRLGRLWLRAALFVPLSALVWLCHAFGWGVLGALAFSAEVVRAWDRNPRIIPALWRGGLAVLPLTPPFLLLLLWRSGGGGETGDWFNMPVKMHWAIMVLRDEWKLWDVTGLVGLVFLLWFAARDPRLAWSRNLVASALFLLGLYLLLPRILFGSAYADMRLAPFVLAVAVLAIRRSTATSDRLASGLAIAGLLFLGARLAGHTASFALHDRVWTREAGAIAALPHGARVAAFVGRPCRETWGRTRLEHLPSLAIARRDAFANNQWTLAGAQLLSTRLPGVGAYGNDPSQIVLPTACARPAWAALDARLRGLPRGVFTHVWLIDPPAHDPRSLGGLEPVWRSGTSLLYADRRSRPPARRDP